MLYIYIGIVRPGCLSVSLMATDPKKKKKKRKYDKNITLDLFIETNMVLLIRYKYYLGSLCVIQAADLLHTTGHTLECARQKESGEEKAPRVLIVGTLWQPAIQFKT